MQRFPKKDTRRNQKKTLDYQKMEPRQLLSVNAPNIGPSVNSQLVDGFREADLVVIDNARDYLTSQIDTQYLLTNNSDLRPIEVKHGIASTTTRFQQVLAGVPVHNAIVTVNQGPDGDFQRVHHDLAYRKLLLPQVDSADFNIELAEQIASEHAGVVRTLAETRGELSWYVDENGNANKVWDITVYGSNPTGDFLTLIDVHSGEVLLQENRASFFETGTGNVFEPNPWQTQGSGAGLDDADDADSAALDAQMISVTLEGLDEGTGLLTGEFVDLATLNSPDLPDVDADEADRVYEYTRSDDRFEQVVIYHSVDQMNRYFHDLGFDDDTGTPNGIRDFPSLANAHWFDADQSFYSGGDDAIHFGDGGVDDGEDADIVAHEYGHAIQNNQNAAWGGGEMGAMGEGFGDYLAASFYFDFGDATFQGDHAAAVGEWDATSYSSDDPPNLRRVDGNKMYPDDLGNGVHADGEIWSRALWDLRANVGGPWADQLVLEHHFTLAAGATMTMAAEEILIANENINSDVYRAAVRNPFVERGILQAETLVSFNSMLYDADDAMAGPITIAVSDSSASGSVDVVVETADGDVETVTLTEDANGLFVGTITVVGAGFTTENGIVEVLEGTTDITVTYGTETDEAQVLSDVVTSLTVGEVGRLESVTDLWQTVDLVKSYNDPVIVAGPSSRSGASPVNVRIRNVSATSFEIHIDEWEYDDGRHRNPETVDYLVMEAGEFELQDGTLIVAGNRTDQTHVWTTNSLSDTFANSDQPPVILSQTITENDPISVTTRTRRVSNTEFQIRVQEEEGQGRNGAHGEETVSWIAIEQRSGTIGRQAFVAGSTGLEVDHRNFNIDFGSAFDAAPAFLANFQTFQGGDTATVRYRSLTPTNATIYLEEERSNDREIFHVKESVGFLAIELGEILGSSSEFRPAFAPSDSAGNGKSNLDQRVVEPELRNSTLSQTDNEEDTLLDPTELTELAGSIILETNVLDDLVSTESLKFEVKVESDLLVDE